MEHVVAWAILGAVGTVVSGILALRNRRRDAALPPVAAIASAPADTFVRIIGTIVEGGIVHAPITGRACVCFSAAAHPILKVRKGDETFRHFQPHVSRVGSADFLVEDASGRIAVDASGLEIRANLDYTTTVTRAPKLADPTILSEAAYDELRLDEGVINAGAVVVLEGVVHRGVAAPDSTVFRAGESAVSLVASRDRSTAVSNLPAALESAAKRRGVALAKK